VSSGKSYRKSPLPPGGNHVELYWQSNTTYLPPDLSWTFLVRIHQKIDARLKIDLYHHEIHNSRLPIIKCTTLFYSVLRCNTLHITSKRHVDAYLDPTLVPNGCWDQKLDHLLGLINYKNKQNLPYQLLNVRPSSTNFRALILYAMSLSGK
jgi:hypothetical protein